MVTLTKPISKKTKGIADKHVDSLGYVSSDEGAHWLKELTITPFGLITDTNFFPTNLQSNAECISLALTKPVTFSF